MNCFICKESLDNTNISEYVPLNYKNRVVYAHTSHEGVNEEYESQKSKELSNSSR